MSMTREEASEHLFDDWYIENGRLCVDESNRDDFCKALGVGIKTLRPVSREQVERMRAKWITVHDTSGRDWSKCGSCQAELDGLEDAYNFCPSCGAPMTGEAVQMVMERMEALHETVE